MGDTKDKIKQIYEALPHLNCGQCGFEGCGQFAKAVAEGRASPFGCRQDPWAGYRVAEIMGDKATITGSPSRFGRSSSGQGQAPASIGSLREEVGELSRRVQGMIGRINNLERNEAIPMPRPAVTATAGRGPGTGWGLGRGGGRGMMGGGSGFGVGGECVCPNCGYRVAHQRSTPCYQVRCPHCGSSMAR